MAPSQIAIPLYVYICKEVITSAIGPTKAGSTSPVRSIIERKILEKRSKRIISMARPNSRGCNPSSLLKACIIKPPSDSKPETIARLSKKTCRLVESSSKQGNGRILRVTSNRPSKTINDPIGMIKFASMRNSRAEDKSKTYTRFATAITKARDSKKSEWLVLCLADLSDVCKTFGIFTL